MKGNLILIKDYSWMGQKIRQVTSGNYNHVGMFVSDNKIVEASMLGVKLSDLYKFHNMKYKGNCDYNIFRWTTLSKEEIEIMCQYLLNQVGCKYDYLQLFALLLYFTTDTIKKISYFDMRKAFICSELISSALDVIGKSFSDKIDKDYITPKDIAESNLVEMI